VNQPDRWIRRSEQGNATGRRLVMPKQTGDEVGYRSSAYENPGDPLRDVSAREFNDQFNLALLGEQLPKASVRQVLKHYVGSVAIYGVLLLFIATNPWFSLLLNESFRGVSGTQIYCILFTAYVVLAPIVFLVFRPASLWHSKNLLVLGYLGRVVHTLFRGTGGHESRGYKPDYQETNALMFLLIKLVYGPLMLCSAMLELDRIPTLQFQLIFKQDWLRKLDVWFLIFVSGIFLLDSLIYFMGYTTEAGFMRNRLRYAETNLYRILVCIVCYAPFNMVTIAVLGPSHRDVGILFQGDLEHPLTWVLRGLAALSLLGLISSSLFLFTKASNLTNRGIVKIGPYALVRHPAIISKNMFWLMTIIPLFIPNRQSLDFSWASHAIICGSAMLGYLGWGTIYFLRAVTEEEFLRKDPEYVDYCRKVKYRFIPWVY
jgi:protein-S-isoprenylcysteine O-methyltransferase Ste14